MNHMRCVRNLRSPTTEEQTTNNDDHTVFEDLAGIVRTSAADNGVHMWTHVTGEQGSSTRMEIAAAVLALHIKKAIFIGSDSKSMVDKAKWLIAKAKEAEAKSYPSTHRPTKNPGKCRRMGTCGNGSGNSLEAEGLSQSTLEK